MDSVNLVLASGSPRRAELLRQIGVDYRIVPSCVEEGQPQAPWREGVISLARAKALAVSAYTGPLVLAADTIVVIDDRVLGKPRDTEEAFAMLSMLSGRTHEVITGLCLADVPRSKIYQEAQTTKVRFRKLTKKEIQDYLQSGESLDKAGAYGIQGLGALLVDRIEGCYFNVVGLPLVKVMYLLRRCGMEILGQEDA